MKLGSLFTGIGAMDLACEQHFGARTVWQVEREPYCREVLARHWPDADRSVTDVREAGADNLAPVDIICGGPPCVDLSQAGRRKGLHADRSGLFFDMVRICAELKPRWVVVENVLALLTDWRGTVEGAFADAGYGVTWARVSAQHAGAPHLRWRTVLLCELGGRHQGVCHPSPLPSLDGGVRWPTPTARCGTSGPSQIGREGHGGPALHDVVAAGTRWPTPAARDWKDTGHEPAAQARNSPCLPARVVAGDPGAVLCPRWEETLQGLPEGWTSLDEPLTPRPWPLPAVEDMWGASPQHDLEPPRARVERVPHRTERIKALGNCCPPQQYLLALAMLHNGPRQGLLF